MSFVPRHRPRRHRGRLAAALGGAAVALPALLAASGCGGPADAAGQADLTVMTWSPSATGSFDRPGMTELAGAIGRGINDQGGLDGHKVRVLTCNEHNTADGAAACAKQAVDAGAVAVVGSYSQFGENFMPALESAGIPYLGGYGLSAPEFTSPVSYPVAGGMPALIAGSGRQLAAAGCRTVSLIRPDTPAGDSLVGELASALNPAGIKLLDVPAQEKSTDYTATARTAIGGDQPNNCVTAALSPVPTQNLLDSFRRMPHTNTRLASVIGSFQQSVVDSTGGDSGPLGGAYATGWYPPETSKTWDPLRATVLKYAAGQAEIDVSDPGVQTTWVAYQVFQQAIDKLPAGRPITAKALRDVLDSGEQFTTGGATPPLAWGLTNMLASADSPRLVNTSVTFQLVQGGRLVEQQPGFVDVRWVLTGGTPPAGA
ncbi:ABC-type branched-subunit amino acid transport system substrate-binding protein [Kitasatospora sp. MAP12-15]|uniref:ABC transporter substrate-binding protein n=1 Tax=unclassified Kitasatospora TaxID=2633591 RepID=UPI002473184C|nr:ABC transporter substrate-binding protein [Kitasatospora sp. MAP12-44]MDH6112342.1 ABC-type branched-subunit amino acid transport system substrate-binding protein [Kitasatospora sp. MAP12-44]